VRAIEATRSGVNANAKPERGQGLRSRSRLTIETSAALQVNYPTVAADLSCRARFFPSFIRVRSIASLNALYLAYFVVVVGDFLDLARPIPDHALF
jgi:hypothetical protein